MAQIKWNGPFTSVDKSTRTVISGDVWGIFEGEVSAEQEHSLRTLLVGALPVVFRDSDSPVLELIAQPDVIAGALQERLAEQLADLGVSGTVQVLSGRLSPESEAKVRAAMGQADSSPAVGSAGSGLQEDLANEMVNRVAAAARGGRLTQGKIILLAVGVVVVVALAVAAGFVFPRC